MRKNNIADFESALTIDDGTSFSVLLTAQVWRQKTEVEDGTVYQSHPITGGCI